MRHDKQPKIVIDIEPGEINEETKNRYLPDELIKIPPGCVFIFGACAFPDFFCPFPFPSES